MSEVPKEIADKMKPGDSWFKPSEPNANERHLFSFDCDRIHGVVAVYQDRGTGCFIIRGDRRLQGRSTSVSCEERFDL